MSDVKIHANQVGEAKIAAKAIETSIKRTNNRCETLLSYVYSASWSGKTRDAFLTYLEIIKQYNEELTTIVAKQTKALNNLEKYTNDFLQDGSVKQVRNL